MRRIFLTPIGILDDRPRSARFQSVGINETQAMLIIDEWIEEETYDYLIAQPGVVEFFPWDMDRAAPSAVVDAAMTTNSLLARAASGDASVDPLTIGDALRAFHPHGPRLFY